MPSGSRGLDLIHDQAHQLVVFAAGYLYLVILVDGVVHGILHAGSWLAVKKERKSSVAGKSPWPRTSSMWS